MAPKVERSKKSAKGKANEADSLHRHLLILRMIPRRGRISTSEIVDRLEREHNMTVELRTVQRNLNSLARVFPLTGDGNRPQGWSWAADSSHFDIPALDPQTALTFNLVERFIKGLVPPATISSLAPYFRNAAAILEAGTVGVLGRWPEKVHVLARGDLLLPPRVPEQVMENIYEALYREVRCRIQYRPKNRNESVCYEANPLGLVFVGKVPYLVAALWDYDDVKQLPLQRMEQVELLQKPVTTPKGFSLQGYIQSGEFRYPVDTKKIRLVLHMSPERAKHLEETPLCDGQKMALLPDGRMQVEALVSDTLELRFWLHGFGADLEVVEPQALRQEFTDMVECMASLYRAR